MAISLQQVCLFFPLCYLHAGLIHSTQKHYETMPSHCLDLRNPTSPCTMLIKYICKPICGHLFISLAGDRLLSQGLQEVVIIKMTRSWSCITAPRQKPKIAFPLIYASEHQWVECRKPWWFLGLKHRHCSLWRFKGLFTGKKELPETQRELGAYSSR